MAHEPPFDTQGKLSQGPSQGQRPLYGRGSAVSGLLFENLCVRDLRVYASANDGGVYHYRDSLGLESDAVVHLRDGRYGLIEIKMGGESLVEEGANNLRKLAERIDQTSMGKPSFLMVLTAVGDYSYPREDGVIVYPIGCLGA